MFFRYANNLPHGGAIAWNPNGAPTYGLTSVLFLAIVLPLRLVFDFNPYAVVTTASLVCGLLFLVGLRVVIRRHAGQSLLERRVGLLMVYLAFAASAVPLAIQSISGVDTTFAMTFVPYIPPYILADGRTSAKYVTTGPNPTRMAGNEKPTTATTRHATTSTSSYATAVST